MARIGNYEKEGLGFYTNNNGEIQYHKVCARCKNKCKQSYRCIDVFCIRYERR